MKKLIWTLLTLLACARGAEAQIVNAQVFRLNGGSGQCNLTIGSGDPTGVVTGGTCDMFFRTDGTTDNTVYVKSGSGTSGWTAVGAGGGGGGDVTGPGSSTSGHLASFNGTGGDTLQDAGIASSAVVTLTGSQTLTNKTFTSPIFGTISNTGTLTLPTSTDTLVGRATSDTLTNKTLTTPTIGSFANAGHNHQDSAGGGTLAEAALATTDITTANATTSKHGFLLKLDNNAAHFMNGQGTWATPSGGGGGITGPGSTTSGVIPVWNSTDGTTVGAGSIAAANVALLDAANVFSSATGQSMKAALFPGSSSGTTTVVATAAAGTTTLTLPAATDTLVGKATTDTMTNKTLTTPTIGSFANATHDHTNSAGGGQLAEGALATTDITTNNATTSKHGFLLKLDNTSTHYMDGTGAWSTPAGGGGGAVGSDLTRRQWWIQISDDAEATITSGKDSGGINITTFGSGIATNDVTNTSMSYRFTTGATSGDTSGWANNGSSIVRLNYLPSCTWDVTTNSDISSVRIWMGLSSTSSLSTDTPTTGNLKFVGWRFSTNASDTTWVTNSDLGSSSLATRTSSGITVATSTRYKLKFVVTTTSNIDFYVNGSLTNSITTNIPTGSSLRPVLWIETLAAGAKSLGLSRWSCEAN